jgi:hypothetical protein
MKYLIFALCLGLSMSLSAQDLVIYNYKTGKIKNIKPRRYGNFVTLRIDNINTFKYKVTIQGEDIEYTTPIPSELQTLFRIQDRYAAEDKGSLLEAVGNTTASAKKMEALSKNIQKTSTVKLTTDMDNLVKACNSIKQPTKDIAEVQYTRMELISLSKQKWEDYAALSTALSGINPPNRDKMKRDYMGYIEKYRKVESVYDKALITIEQAVGSIDQDSIKNELDYIGKNKEETAAVKAAAAAYAHAIADNTRHAKSQILKSYKHIKEAYKTLEYDGNEYLQLIEDVLTLYTALNNKKNFEVLSAPIQLDTDFASFKIEVVPMKSNALLPIEHSKTADFKIGTRGGWKADFSVGATLAFGAGMKDSLYSIEPDGATGNSYLRAGKNHNVARPGLAAMMHFYPRTGKPIAFGGMFGVGADFKAINDPDISLFLGGSLILGIREKIMISGGVSFQRVVRNKSNYVVDQAYNTNDISLEDVQQKAFIASPFIAVSYNLTTRRNLTFK